MKLPDSSAIALAAKNAETRAAGQNAPDPLELVTNMLAYIQQVVKEGLTSGLETDLTVFIGTLITTFAAISVIPLESNFGGYAAGNLIGQSLRPIITRTITDPVDDILKQVFRYEYLQPFVFMRPGVFEVFGDDAIRDSMVGNGFKDSEITKALKAAHIIEALNNYKYWVTEDMAQESEYVDSVKLRIAAYRAEYVKALDEVYAVDLELTTLQARTQEEDLKDLRTALRSQYTAALKKLV